MRRNCKKISVPIIALYLFVASIAIVFAVTETEKTYDRYRSARNDEDKIEYLQSYAGLIIEERLGAIRSFSSQLGPDYRILEVDKTVINTLLDESKAQLIEYRDEARTVESLDELRLIVDNVYNKARIYKVIMPKAYGWRTVARSDYILRNNVLVYIEDLKQASKYLKSQGVNTSQIDQSLTLIEESSDELHYRVRLVKESLDEMEPGRDLSEERSLLAGAQKEMETIQTLLEDVQFEMRQVVKMLDPHY